MNSGESHIKFFCGLLGQYSTVPVFGLRYYRYGTVYFTIITQDEEEDDEQTDEDENPNKYTKYTK